MEDIPEIAEEVKKNQNGEESDMDFIFRRALKVNEIQEENQYLIGVINERNRELNKLKKQRDEELERMRRGFNHSMYLLYRELNFNPSTCCAVQISDGKSCSRDAREYGFCSNHIKKELQI